MSYDAAAVRRMGVDPSSWKWFNSDCNAYAPYAVSSQTSKSRQGNNKLRFASPTIALSVYLIIWLSLGVLSGGNPIITVVVALALLLTMHLCSSPNTFLKVIGLIPSSLMALGILYLASVGYFLHAFSSAATMAGAICVSLLFHRYKKNGLDYSDPVLEYIADPHQRVFGVPGKVASAVDKFGQEAVDAGVKGEENTAVLLELLLKIPGTTVYHGLRFPGSKEADVDHAVACGNTVFLIDSKLYRWGEYEWKAGKDSDEIVRTDGYGRPRKNHMHAAAEGYRKILGPNINVTPIVLLHGKKVRVSDKRVSDNGVVMGTANDAMQHIGDTLYMRLKSWSDNTAVAKKLIENLK